jgi:hypothetical protein
VRINGYRTDSEPIEHRGFAHLLKGVFGSFRNPPAHTPCATVGWALTEPAALDLFSMLSLVHRRLDGAHIGGPAMGYGRNRRSDAQPLEIISRNSPRMAGTTSEAVPFDDGNRL